MMANDGFGCWVQKFFSERGLVDKVRRHRSCLALAGGYAPLANYAVFGYEPELYQFVSLGLAALIGLLSGWKFRWLCALMRNSPTRLKVNAAWFLFGLVGSFVGAIIWLKWLLPNFAQS